MPFLPFYKELYECCYLVVYLYYPRLWAEAATEHLQDFKFIKYKIKVETFLLNWFVSFKCARKLSQKM